MLLMGSTSQSLTMEWFMNYNIRTIWDNIDIIYHGLGHQKQVNKHNMNRYIMIKPKNWNHISWHGQTN